MLTATEQKNSSRYPIHGIYAAPIRNLKIERNLYQQGLNIKDTTSNQLIEQDGNKRQRKRPKTHRETKNNYKTAVINQWQ